MARRNAGVGEQWPKAACEVASPITTSLQRRVHLDGELALRLSSRDGLLKSPLYSSLRFLAIRHRSRSLRVNHRGRGFLTLSQPMEERVETSFRSFGRSIAKHSWSLTAQCYYADHTRAGRASKRTECRQSLKSLLKWSKFEEIAHALDAMNNKARDAWRHIRQKLAQGT